MLSNSSNYCKRIFDDRVCNAWTSRSVLVDMANELVSVDDWTDEQTNEHTNSYTVKPV
jgi:hypothetical protein